MKKVNALLMALLAAATPVMAASDYLLELDGIKGESKDDVHKGTIELASWSLGASNPTSIGASGLSAGKVSMQDFHFAMPHDSSLPALIAACATGQHIKQAKLFVRKAGDDKRQDYLTVTLTDVLISGFSMSSGGDRPSESISMSYSKIEFRYVAQNDAGVPVEVPPFAYDVVNAVPILGNPTEGTPTGTQ